jgi:hypothetical protein
MDKKQYQPHQQRVVNEATDLKTKADTLVNFISVNPLFKTLKEDEQERLRKQAGLMFQYYEVLEERISNF